jgi:hypothetical protein
VTCLEVGDEAWPIWMPAQLGLRQGARDRLVDLHEGSKRMEEVKRRVRQTPELTQEQISGIEQKLDDLTEASERVGRKDWLVMLYGTAFGLIVNDAVPPHVVQSVITMAIHALAHVFGLGGPPPSLPTLA